MDGYVLLEIVGGEVTTKKMPPEPVLPALPRRVVAKVKRPVVIETTAEVVS